MALPTEGKIERIGLRITPTAKQTLKRAAAAANKSVSEFLLEYGTSPLAAAEFHDPSPEKKVERIVLRISPSTKHALKRVAGPCNFFSVVRHEGAECQWGEDPPGYLLVRSSS